MAHGSLIAEGIEKAFASTDDPARQFANLFAEDGVQHHPFFPAPLIGRDAIAQAEGGMFAAFDEVILTVNNVIESGDQVCLEMEVRARHTKPLAMPDGNVVPPTDKVVDLIVAATMRVNSDGLIVECRRYQDNLGFLQQLGLV